MRTDGVALVTGGASGIGKAVAHRLAADGATVVITDVQCRLGEATAAEGGFTFFEQDVCDEKQWTRTIQAIEARHGRLTIVVNNAGTLGPPGAWNPELTPLTTWRQIFAVNVEGVFLGCRSTIAPMRRAGGGSIINISSAAALLATPFAMAYGASKAAVRHLTKSIAQYCAEQNTHIRCNSVHPGHVPTPLWLKRAEETARALGTDADQVMARARQSIPLGDFTLAEDVAAAVAFLASPDARHVTGTELIVDGGIVNCDTYAQTRNREPMDRKTSPISNSVMPTQS